jgi:acetylglutamate kinase
VAAPISVVKISGHYLDDEARLGRFARTVAGRDDQIVIVHGGGKEISRLQERLDIRPRYVDGLRITDAESLALVEMVLCGSVNKRVVRHLLTAGVDAQGLSGVDRGLVRARQLQHPDVDMCFTGTVESVRPDVIAALLDLGVTPVIAPVSLGHCSNFNLNADPVAGALAAAIKADNVVFISNVSGVLVNDHPIGVLTAPEARKLMATGVIHGGMIPKVESALEVLLAGVPQVIITDLEGWASGGGTTIIHQDAKVVSRGKR